MATLDWSQCPALESVPGRLSGAWVFRDTRMPLSDHRRFLAVLFALGFCVVSELRVFAAPPPRRHLKPASQRLGYLIASGAYSGWPSIASGSRLKFCLTIDEALGFVPSLGEQRGLRTSAKI